MIEGETRKDERENEPHQDKAEGHAEEKHHENEHKDTSVHHEAPAPRYRLYDGVFFAVEMLVVLLFVTCTTYDIGMGTFVVN